MMRQQRDWWRNTHRGQVEEPSGITLGRVQRRGRDVIAAILSLSSKMGDGEVDRWIEPGQRSPDLCEERDPVIAVMQECASS